MKNYNLQGIKSSLSVINIYQLDLYLFNPDCSPISCPGLPVDRDCLCLYLVTTFLISLTRTARNCRSYKVKDLVK